MIADSAELNGLLAHCAGTHDDTARLVLADWLEDHDDFRAGFVRTAVAFDRTPPYDVTRFQLGERLRALLESPAFTDWLPACPGFQWGWRRGLLALRADTGRLEVEVEIDETQALARWLLSNWIERVEFEQGSSPRWEDTFGLIRNARDLYFKTDNYGPDVLSYLCDWPHLRWLRMSYLGGGEAWAELAGLPHLRALTLDNPDWTMMPELHKARLPNLEVLDLDKEWEDNLPHWGECFPKLRSLALTQYNAYPDEQCERFAECSQLQHLALYQKYEPFTRVGLKALAKLTELRSLTLGPVPRGTIAGFATLPRLERLGTYGEGKTIRGLESLTQLRWLWLGLRTLTGKTAAQIIKLPQVSRLDLSLGTYEAGALAALADTPSLRILTLALNLSDRKDPWPELVRLEQLRYLRVWGYNVPDPELHSLQAALPACRIVRGWQDTDEGEYDWS
jgi:uncharacterized protein (TIGR02996 family)